MTDSAACLAGAAPEGVGCADVAGRPPSALVLPRSIHAEIIAHLTSRLPNEGVGLLAVRDQRRSLRAVRFYPGENEDRSPLRYTMSPAEVSATLRDIEDHGGRLGAIVHSHPRTPPVPSATDLMEAATPGVLSVIVGFEPACAVRAWRLDLDHAGTAIRAREVAVDISGWTVGLLASSLARLARQYRLSWPVEWGQANGIAECRCCPSGHAGSGTERPVE
jgi:proteasome lid subunit RPN8/RPN11